METFDVQSENRERDRPKVKLAKCNYLIFCVILLSGFAGLLLYRYYFKSLGDDDLEDVLQEAAKDSLVGLDSTCEEELCLSKHCITSAARILRFMDDQQSPCEDFYGYACGSYGKQLILRAGEYVYNPFVEAEDNMMIYIKKMFDEPDAVNQTSSFQKVRILYESCTDNKNREAYSTKELLGFLKDSGIPWPLFDKDQAPEDTAWPHAAKVFAKYGIDTVFKPKIERIENSSTVVLDVGCSLTVWPPEVYLDPIKNEDQLNFYEDAFVLLVHTLNFKRVEARKLFRQILQVETELSRALRQVDEGNRLDCEDSCSTHVNPGSCELIQNTTKYPLSEQHVEQLGEIWSGLFREEELQLQVTSTCKGNVEAALKALDCAPRKAALNYVTWRGVMWLAQFLALQHQKIYNYYVDKLINGSTVPMGLWRECSNLVRKEMGLALVGALTEKNYLSEEHHIEVYERFEKTKESFKFLFYTVPWLRNSTIQKFSAKVDAVKLHLGIPDEMKESGNYADDLYADLQLDQEDSFFKNYLRLSEFKTRKRFERLEIGENQDSWKYTYLIDRTPLGTRASYDYVKNEITIDYGLVITPLMKFGDGLPEYLKLGQNAVLAREISRTLDSTGIQYDAKRRFTGSKGLPKRAQQKFQKFTSCLLEKYPTSSVDVLNDDIADLGAFFITSAGLELELQFEPVDATVKQLPGLPLTRRQIYFLQSAQMFCEFRDDDWSRSNNENKSGRDRLNMVISNMVNFGSEFKCDLESPMNPSDKCNLLN